MIKELTASGEDGPVNQQPYFSALSATTDTFAGTGNMDEGTYIRPGCQEHFAGDVA